MRRQAQVPPVVADYVARHPHLTRAYALGPGHPVIVAEYTPGVGWRRATFRKRISGAWAQKRRRAGVTAMQLDLNPALGPHRHAILADFSIAELCRR